MKHEFEQDLDTEVQISRAPAFGVFTFRMKTKQGDDLYVTMDMESSIYVLENLDKGEEVFKEKRASWFALFLGKFKRRS